MRYIGSNVMCIQRLSPCRAVLPVIDIHSMPCRRMLLLVTGLLFQSSMSGLLASSSSLKPPASLRCKPRIGWGLGPPPAVWSCSSKVSLSNKWSPSGPLGKPPAGYPPLTAHAELVIQYVSQLVQGIPEMVEHLQLVLTLRVCLEAVQHQEPLESADAPWPIVLVLPNSEGSAVYGKNSSMKGGDPTRAVIASLVGVRLAVN